MIIPQKRTPFAEPQIGGQQGGLGLVALLHQGEEQPDLSGFDLDVPDLINQDYVVSQVFLEDLSLGGIGGGAVEFADQLGKQDGFASIALIDGLNEKTGGQARLAASGPAQPHDVLFVGHQADRIKEDHNLRVVQLVF